MGGFTQVEGAAGTEADAGGFGVGFALGVAAG